MFSTSIWSYWKLNLSPCRIFNFYSMLWGILFFCEVPSYGLGTGCPFSVSIILVWHGLTEPWTLYFWLTFVDLNIFSYKGICIYTCSLHIQQKLSAVFVSMTINPAPLFELSTASDPTSVGFWDFSADWHWVFFYESQGVRYAILKVWNTEKVWKY